MALDLPTRACPAYSFRISDLVAWFGVCPWPYPSDYSFIHARGGQSPGILQLPLGSVLSVSFFGWKHLTLRVKISLILFHGVRVKILLSMSIC